MRWKYYLAIIIYICPQVILNYCRCCDNQNYHSYEEIYVDLYRAK